MPRLTVVDLFSGAGGMSQGFKSRDDLFEIIAAVDLEKGKPGNGKSPGSSTGCNPTYERNIGIRPKNADIGSLSPSAFRADIGIERGELSVLISCAPCTGFSQKNASNHSNDDPRNALVQRTADFVAELRPEFLVMENVKELLTGKQRHHFEKLRRRLENDLGYAVWAEVHDFADLGLPQRRRRALVIARRDGPLIGLPSILKPTKTVRDAIGMLPPIVGGEPHPSDPMHVSPSNTPPVLARIKAIPRDGGSWADVMRSSDMPESEKVKLLTPAMFKARPGSFPDVYGRLWWDKPAITITRECGHVGNGRYTHPEQDRLLSVREMALLQGFPKSYYFEGPITAKYNQIGDAVPPAISKLIADHIAFMKEGEAKVYRELKAICYQQILDLEEKREVYVSRLIAEETSG